MRRFGRRDFVKTVGATAAAAGLVAAPAVRRADAQAKTIVFGGSVPLSGRAAETGLNVNNGYLMAIKYLNEEMGGVEIGGEKYKLELKMFDDASDPARATTLIQRQIDEGVDFFLGSFGSNIVLPTAAITERAKRPMVQSGGGSDQIFTQGFKYVFGMFPRASRQFISSVEFFKAMSPRPKSISVIFTNDAFSKTNAEGAAKDSKAAGFDVLEMYGLPEQITDVSSVLASVRSKTPDVLICTTHDQNSLLISRQMVATNTNVPLLYQTLGPQLATYRETLGKFATGICVQIYWDERAPYKDKFFGTAQKFAEYYRKHVQRPIAYHTAGGAACIVTYVQAMQAAKSIKTEPVRDALAATDVDTLYGRVKFTPEGDGDAILLGPAVGQVQKGVVQLVHPAAAKTGTLIYPTPKWSEKT
ncbi:MAG: amino acid ABC transporter substrate-binding protein [Alphaproteobacteria bacterium]|nr:amino acid ABC transporter substrate-binding protein [Alphaproteobacteria bacterium]